MCDRLPALSVGGVKNTAIDVDNLRKPYDGQPALCGSSLAIGAGEIFSIARRTGVGKTPTLKIIEGPGGPDRSRVALVTATRTLWVRFMTSPNRC